MIRHAIQTTLWKYDTYVTALVALLPKSAYRASAALDKMTLPIIWAVAVISISLIHLYLGNTAWAKIGFIVALSIPIATVLKLIIRRERPKTIYAQKMKIKSYGFPSSHAYSAALAGGYVAVMSAAVFSAPLGGIIAAIYICLIITIGTSRIHIGAHYPTDVTAGWLLGAAALYAITKIIL